MFHYHLWLPLTRIAKAYEQPSTEDETPASPSLFSVYQTEATKNQEQSKSPVASDTEEEEWEMVATEAPEEGWTKIENSESETNLLTYLNIHNRWFQRLNMLLSKSVDTTC